MLFESLLPLGNKSSKQKNVFISFYCYDSHAW